MLLTVNPSFPSSLGVTWARLSGCSSPFSSHLQCRGGPPGKGCNDDLARKSTRVPEKSSAEWVLPQCWWQRPGHCPLSFCCLQGCLSTRTTTGQPAQLDSVQGPKQSNEEQ